MLPRLCGELEGAVELLTSPARLPTSLTTVTVRQEDLLLDTELEVGFVHN